MTIKQTPEDAATAPSPANMADTATTGDAPPPRSLASGDVVTYIGTADVRDIDAKAWKGVGADGQGKVQWDKSNKFQIPVDQFSPEALAYFDTDAEFVIGPAKIK